jgi:hypothetical protein
MGTPGGNPPDPHLAQHAPRPERHLAPHARSPPQALLRSHRAADVRDSMYLLLTSSSTSRAHAGSATRQSGRAFQRARARALSFVE